jgi:hypothetical protein
MKITKDAFEIAKASAKDSEVPLILTGEHGLITDVMVSPASEDFDTSAGMLPSMLPAGIRKYGKVVTKSDKELEPGYNLIDEGGTWKFVDEDGKELMVDVVENPLDDEIPRGLLEDP